MPRLPTMRVMGSHAISTSWPGSRLTCDGSGMIVVIRLRFLNALHPKARQRNDQHLPGASRSGFEFRAGVPPARLLVDGASGDVAQAADHRSVQARGRAGKLAARGLIHEGHKLVGEAGHGATDADSADI